LIFRHLGEARLQSIGAQLRGPLQNISEVAGLHGDAAELAEHRLLPQPVGKLVANERYVRKFGIFPGGLTKASASRISE